MRNIILRLEEIDSEKTIIQAANEIRTLDSEKRQLRAEVERLKAENERLATRLAHAEADGEQLAYYDEITEQELRAEVGRLRAELAANADMLAKQCDLAREAETNAAFWNA